jgi:hypothetical protein
LNSIFSRLIEQLAGAPGGRALFGLEDVPGADAALLKYRAR